MNPNTVGISVYKKGTSAPISDADLQQLPMLDIDGGQVSIQMVPSTGETGPSTYKVVIPDYYGFSGVSATGSNYTSAVVSTDNTTNANAKNNVLTITIPAPANPQQPSQVSLSFNIALNRNSIPKDKQEAWEKGTWHPNNQGNVFKIEKTSDSSVKSEKPARFSYVLADTQAPTMSTEDTGPGNRWVLDANGVPADEWDYKGTKTSKLNFVMSSTDVYVNGPKNVKQIVVKAPADMYFSGKAPAGASVSLSADKKTATITDITVTPDSKGKITLKGLEILPNPEYQNKQDPFAKRFAPKTELPVSAHVEYLDGSAYDLNDKFVVVDYKSEETAAVYASPGTDDSGKLYAYYNDGKKTHILYDIVSGGTNNRSKYRQVFTTSRPNYSVQRKDKSFAYYLDLRTPKDMGTDLKNEITFGDQADPTKYIKLKQFSFYNYGGAYGSNEQGLAQYKIKKMTYYTVNHPEGITITPPKGTTTVKADPGDAITKAEFVYDAFVFVGVGPYSQSNEATNLISGLVYDVAPTEEQMVFVPMTSKIIDKQGTEVASALNEILINMGSDPIFGLFGKEGVKKDRVPFKPDTHFDYNSYSEPGRYADGNEYLNYTFGIRSDKVGGSSGALSKLDNPWIENLGSRAAIGESYSLGNYFTNGHVVLHKLMNDGKWTVEVRTVSASEWAKNPTKPAPVSAVKSFPVPAFSGETADLHLDQLVGLKSDELIYDFTFKYNGTLDISYINGTGADRAFYDVYMNNLDRHPVLGTLFGGYHSERNYADSNPGRAENNNVYIRFDNSQDVGKTHSPENYHRTEVDSEKPVSDRHRIALKGAEVAAPRNVSADPGSSTLRQGGKTTIKMDVTYSNSIVDGKVNPNSRLSVQKGWTAYLKLNPETLKYTAPVAGSGKIEGVADPNSKIVEINGEKYLKITYTGDEVEKAPSGASYAPISIEWESYSIPSTPVTKPITVVDSGYIDVSNKQEWTYQKDGVTYKAGIDSAGATGKARKNSIALNDLAKEVTLNEFVNGTVVKDDPLGLHKERAANERAFALVVPELKLQPNKDVLTGLTLVPGLDGEGFQNKEQKVATNQEGKERVLISLIAGDADLNGVSTTIKLPRVGESAQLDGAAVTQDVSQYLTGPVTRYQDPTNPASSKMLVKYSLDGGNSYVDDSQVSDWSQVTHLQVSDEVLKANDAEVLLIPLTTEHKKNNDGKASVGKAYWNALARIGEGGAETTRELLFSYAGHTVSGEVWVDKNSDGKQNDGEVLYTSKAVAMKLMKGDEVLQTVYTTSDGTANGTPTGKYRFTNVANSDGVRVVMELPSGYEISHDPDNGLKNKFTRAANPEVVLASPMPDEVEQVDAGIVVIAEVKAAISAKKVLNGRSFNENDSFEFVLAAKSDGAPLPDENAQKITVKDGTAKAFGDITFKQAGTYVYTVTETVPEGAVENTKQGVKYDTTAKEVTIEVTANAEGALSARLAYPAGTDAATFTNSYGAAPIVLTGDTAIKAKKTLNGREFKSGDSFEFVLSAKSDGAPMPEGTGNKVTVSDGTAMAFGDIKFTKAGTYKYEVKETAGSIAGITYDSSAKEVTVTVTDNGAGGLEVSVAYPQGASAAEFVNTYAAGAVTLTGDNGIKAQKKLTGRDFKTGDSFEFVLVGKENAPMPAAGGEKVTVTDGTAKAFGGITFSKAGTYKYEVKETAGSIAGITYDSSAKEVTVTVADNGSGTLEASVSYGEGAVGAATANAAVFENTYQPNALTITGDSGIKAQKVLNGREFKTGDSFEFVLSAKSDGAPMPEENGEKITVTDGTAKAFGGITFSKAGTYKYEVKETAGSIAGITYDAGAKEVTVTVTDDGAGNLSAKVGYGAEDVTAAVFTNTYAASSLTIGGDSGIKAQKVLTGRDFKSGDSFEFVLSAKSDGAPMPEGTGNKVTVSDGTAKAFGGIKFTKAGTYTYEVKETAGSIPSITYDSTAKEVTVTVTDNGSGTLEASVSYGEGAVGAATANAAVFTNSYSPGSLTISGDNGIKAQKKLTGRDFKTGDSFEFVLSPVTENAPMPTGAGNKVTVTDGTAKAFGGITYTAAGTYTYQITETAGAIPGVTYDTTAKQVTVTVTDDGAGNLSASVSYGSSATAAVFTNSYAASSLTIGGDSGIKAQKVLTGRDFKSGDSFEFVLVGKENAPMPAAGGEKVTVTDGTAKAFGGITYTSAGTYKYEVKETAGSIPGITYDSSAKEVTVTVTDDTEGHLVARVDTVATFTNSYKASAVTLSGDDSIKIAKILQGRDWKDTDRFEFAVTPEQGAPAPQQSVVAVTNANPVSLGKLTFEAAGSYSYQIAEKPGSIEGITYDTQVITATVTITDNQEGQLLANISYSTGAAQAEFKNVYKAKPQPVTPGKPKPQPLTPVKPGIPSALPPTGGAGAASEDHRSSVLFAAVVPILASAVAFIRRRRNG